MEAEKLLELAKKEIHYDRHLTLVGKERADNVLWFWMQGFEYATSQTNELESRLGKALDDFAEVVKERDRLKEELEFIKNHSPLKI